MQTFGKHFGFLNFKSFFQCMIQHEQDESPVELQKNNKKDKGGEIPYPFFASPRDNQ